MYENHRKSFRGERRDHDDDRFSDERWRHESRARRSSFGGPPSDDEPGEWSRRPRSGYGSTFRDDDYGRFGSHEPESSFGSRRDQQFGGDGQWAHDARHSRYGQGASSYGYGAGQPYGNGEGDSRYFTGQQGSWAVRGAYGTAGGGRFGSDYRDHGYDARQDERGFWDRATDEVASWFGDEEAAHRREQDHRGRGPTGYKRSDERISDDANDRLTDDPLVDASSVTVSVTEGEITLDGTVPSRTQKRRAEDIVESISGVKHVQNNLRVSENASAGTGSGMSSWSAASGSSTGEGGGTLGQSGTTTARQTT